MQLARKDDKCTVLGKIVVEIAGVPDFFSQEVVVDEKAKDIDSVLCEICKKGKVTDRINVAHG